MCFELFSASYDVGLDVICILVVSFVEFCRGIRCRVDLTQLCFKETEVMRILEALFVLGATGCDREEELELSELLMTWC